MSVGEWRGGGSVGVYRKGERSVLGGERGEGRGGNGST